MLKNIHAGQGQLDLLFFLSFFAVAEPLIFSDFNQTNR